MQARQPRPGLGTLLVLAVGGCAEPSTSALPAPGHYGLVESGSSGALRGSLVVESDWRGRPSAQVELAGEHWLTPGTVSATVEHGELGGAPATWLAFVVRTAVGEAEAVGRVQGRSFVVPLGARPGEHELSLQLTDLDEGAVPVPAREQVRAELAELEAGWAAGRLRVIDERDGLVGEIILQGSLPPLVAVYDRHWLSPGALPVPAARVDEGGDMLLRFPVEPSIEGEQALLRVNVPTQQVVVPLGAAPEPDERRLGLAVGAVSDTERAAARAQARAIADQEEQAFLADLGPRLVEALRQPSGPGCRALGTLPSHWSLLTAGYTLQTTVTEGACTVWLVPEVEQHRRRHRLRAVAGGAVEISGPD